MSNSPAAPAAGPVLLENISNGIGFLVMNRPEKLNSLNNELAIALNQAFERIGKNDAVRVVVLAGAGRAFCAGGDLAIIGRAAKPDVRRWNPFSVREWARCADALDSAAGNCRGEWSSGGRGHERCAGRGHSNRRGRSGVRAELCKSRTFPDYGGTFSPQLVGPSKAAELFYTGDMIDAQTALKLGLVNKVVPGAQLRRK
jgi:2-(1,2-epoxy-1,2-dihydrophenyl)acetyl-CoA isomerase